MGRGSQTLPVGTLVADKYRVGKMIGKGGMGYVYEAEHLGLRRRVALKVLSASAMVEEEARERFLREARALAAIESDYVVRIFDVERLADDTPALAMEFVEGINLDVHLAKTGRLTIFDTLELGRQMATAVAAVHAAGIFHRDVKPQNFILTETQGGRRRLKLIDFGISKAREKSDEDASLTGTTAILGSAHFLSPEQITTPKAIDARTDVWALGVCFYLFLSGEFPFDSDRPQMLPSLILSSDPKPLSSFRGDVPEGLVALVKKCLSRQQDDRFVDADGVRKELEALLAPPLPEIGSTSDRLTLSAQRHGIAQGGAPPPLRSAVLGSVLRWARSQGGGGTAESWIVPVTLIFVGILIGLMLRSLRGCGG